MSRRNRRGGGLELLLLAEGLNIVARLDTVPPVTLLTVLGQVLLYLGIINPPWNGHEVCLSAESILHYNMYRRLFLAAIEHASDLHLYHNMVSFLLKGRTLEKLFGSVKFFILLLVFILAQSVTYVALAWAFSECFDNYSYMKECAVGFSGVIFALKVLTTHNQSDPFTRVHMFQVPSKYAVWAELIIIHVLVQNASFIGHMSGILVGLVYLYGPLGDIVDTLYTAVAGPPTPHRRSYTYAHGTTRTNYSGTS